LKIYARRSLIDPTLPLGTSAGLLEGSWPDGGISAQRWSLDESLAARHAGIDPTACRLAEMIERQTSARAAGAVGEALVWMNPARLRYHLVKLLRLTSWLVDWPRELVVEHVDLVVERGRDDDYADLIGQWSAARSVPLSVNWRPARAAAWRAPPRPDWRRWAGRLLRWTSMPRGDRHPTAPRVVLCGNPAVLDPVCHELVARGCQAWWLYERFPARSWLRWRPSGVGHLLCDDANSPDASPGADGGEESLGPIVHGDFDLGPAVDRWLRTTARVDGVRQAGLAAVARRHFQCLRPDALVLDQDVTPLARAAVAAARLVGARSLVVQHGAPYGRFGFAPLAADRLLAWGETSRARFAQWGVPADRITVTGSPRHDAVLHGARPKQVAAAARTIVLLATNPPTDSRPDLAAFGLTERSHRELLRVVCAAVARRTEFRLIVKLHPRCRDSSQFRRVLAEFPHVRSRIVRRGELRTVLSGAACAISCGSSSGIEAALWGVPAIELLPPAADELLPAAEWGFVGVARNVEQLKGLLDRALTMRLGEVTPSADVFGQWDGPATGRVVDAILGRELADARAAMPTGGEAVVR
jgi:hypothetical protein